MSASSSHFDRKNQPRPVAIPQSPHTPQRIIPSNFSSPGSGYRSDEDHIVFQIGSRHMYAGFAGDCKPRCKLSFSNRQCTRVGDFRQWLPGYEDVMRPKAILSKWGEDSELWGMDVRSLDMKLVEDRLERTFREAYTRHLLLDSKSRKILLALPSVLPHPLLTAVFTTLFTNFQVPSITLMSTPMLTVLAAGQRSGIVVDIGWHETIITVIYEFREIRQTRTNRAMKRTTLEMGRFLAKFCDDVPTTQPTIESGAVEEDERIEFDFDCIEETTTRVAWCHSVGIEHTRVASNKPMQGGETPQQDINYPNESAETYTSAESTVTVAYSPQKTLEIPFSALCKPVEGTLILDNNTQRQQDEDELSVPFLLYQSLRSLSPEIRAICVSNIIFCGGGSNVPGLKSRILYELDRQVKTRGWDSVWGQAAQMQRQKPREIDGNLGDSRFVQRNATRNGENLSIRDEELNALDLQHKTSGQLQPTGWIKGSSDVKIGICSQIRSLSSLGPWSGASLAGCLKLRGTVEIERETFLQTGIYGARYIRELEMTGSRARQSIATGLGRAVGVDGAQWTLGAWG